MKQMDSPHKNPPDIEWQLLGKFDLSTDSEVNYTIDSWLAELLNPLDLSKDFMIRVFESVQDSVLRILQPNTASATGNIHLSIFAPYDRFSERKTWGFFHIERIENQGEAIVSHDHVIDFYLYMEVQ